MDIQYRKATPSDAVALAELRWEFRFGSRTGPAAVSPAEFQRIYAEYISQSLESGEWVVWVAKLSGEIIAHVYMHIFRKLPNPYAIEKYLGYISNVYTRPLYRSTGIGAALMGHVKDWALQQGQMDVLFLWRSEESEAFYQRQGFLPNPHIMEFEVPPD
jgi:GNAT superfamily N-acetyltransferase